MLAAAEPGLVEFGMPSHKHPPRNPLPQYLNRMPQSCLVVPGAAAWRRPMWMQLAEWEVTAEDGQAGFAEGGSQVHEQQGPAVSSGIVGEDETIAGGALGNVEETTNDSRFSLQTRCLRPLFRPLFPYQQASELGSGKHPAHALIQTPLPRLRAGHCRRRRCA
jgi:hypothetical protein